MDSFMGMVLLYYRVIDPWREDKQRFEYAQRVLLPEVNTDQSLSLENC